MQNMIWMLRSRKYSNDGLPKKFEMWRVEKKRKWARLVQKAETELEHHVIQERGLIVALGKVRRRVARVLAKAGMQHVSELKNLKKLGKLRTDGHEKILASESRWLVQTKRVLQDMRNVQKRYLQKFKRTEKEHSSLVTTLGKSKLRTSRKLRRMFRKRVNWLVKVRERRNAYRRRMAHLARKLHDKADEFKNTLRAMSLRESRRFQRMILQQRQKFRRAALSESRLVVQLRKECFALHKALQHSKRMITNNLRWRESSQRRGAHHLVRRMSLYG